MDVRPRLPYNPVRLATNTLKFTIRSWEQVFSRQVNVQNAERIQPLNACHSIRRSRIRNNLRKYFPRDRGKLAIHSS